MNEALKRLATWRAALLLSSALFVLGFYGHVLESPDAVAMSGSGDGLKNYYTLLWQANRDSSLLAYTGSNAPWGERVHYTDGHTLLSWMIRPFPGVAARSVGLLNVLLLAGLVACALVLQALLLELAVVPWAAALGAFAIMVLQPQIHRMGGHYALAHAWVIPLVMLLSLRVQRRKRWLASGVLVALALLAAYLTHAYLGLMGTMLVLAHGVSRAVLGGGGWHSRRAALVRASIAGLAPMLIFLVLLGWGDPVHDRPEGPLGADLYATRFFSLIAPTHDPFRTPLSEFIDYGKLEWEAWCYLGLSPLLVLVVAAGVQLRRWSSTAPSAPVDDAGQLLGASFLVLLFAMGVWQQWLGAWLPQLEQFRGTGRFAWVFFHGAAVFCAVRVNGWLLGMERPRRWAAAACFFAVVGFMAVEGWAYHRHSSSDFGHGANPFRAESVSEAERALIDALRGAGAHALLPLPWMHVGSEYYAVHAPEDQLAFAMKMAYHSGVPLMAGLTSRTSADQTRSLLSTFGPSYFPKGLRGELPDSARVVLLRHRNPISAEEDSLWSKAAHLVSTEAGDARIVTVGALSADDREHRIAAHARLVAQAPARGAWRFSCRGLPADESLAGLVRFGSDSLAGRVNEWREIIVVEPGGMDAARTYELNFLYETTTAAAININLIAISDEPDGSDGRWIGMRGMRSMPMQLADGVGVASYRIEHDDPSRRFRVLLNGPESISAPYIVRHVVLRPLAVDAWLEGRWRGEPTVFLNGLPLSFARASAEKHAGN